jgi:hypothetical protein
MEGMFHRCYQRHLSEFSFWRHITGRVRPFERSQNPFGAGQVPYETAWLISFITIGFPDMLGKPYNNKRLLDYDCI